MGNAAVTPALLNRFCQVLAGLIMLATLVELAVVAELLRRFCERDVPMVQQAIALVAYGVLVAASGGLMGWAAAWMIGG